VFRFELQPSSATPLYRQIVEQVTRAAAAGVLRDGEELPSVRAVAQEYVINPMTVSKAYSLLEAQGIVERRRGMGMRIVAPIPAAGSDRLLLLQPVLEQAARAARQLGVSTEAALAAFQQTLTQTQSAPGNGGQEAPHE